LSIWRAIKVSWPRLQLLDDLSLLANGPRPDLDVLFRQREVL
jgi:hypothetical protein